MEISLRFGDLEVMGAWADEDFHSSEVLEDRVTRLLAAFAVAFRTTFHVHADEPLAGGDNEGGGE